MRASILERLGQATFIDNTPYSLLEEPYGIVLEPVAVTLCNSDVNMVYGSGSKKPDNPTFGHECIARAKTVVSRVRDFQVGDLVAVPAITPNWRNVEIQEGNDRHTGRPFSGDTFRRNIPGIFAEVFGTANVDTTLVKLSEGVRLEDALMCIDMVTTGFTGVEIAGPKFDNAVVVLGTGAVGLVAVQGVILQGAAGIHAVGTWKVSIRRALELSAIEMLSYKNGDIRE